ncbi:MAG: Lipopolysaccharide assembly protein B [Verrucomicrobia subdivision 3 bacterium]|nr:Lipopolysaccharide assembly protein B [Limisphaerales bacterium]MCS1417889.1 Lipopolysaccharide assembly protein B [Limisphaerales bacterium]
MVFSGIATVFGSLVALITIEGGARLHGIGYPTNFYLKRTFSGQSFLTENHKFFWSFFPKALSRSPQSIQWSPDKPQGTKRIFVFGESAAMGDPEPAFGLSRLLEVLLERRHPNQDYEVINLAVTAINSHVILPIARETSRYPADFWCIYMGNNEVHGQFGPGTVFGSSQSNLRLIRTSLVAKRTRIGQLANAIASSLASSSGRPQEWGGMAMFVDHQVPPDDPRLGGVYQNFEVNLRDIIEAGLQSSAKVLVSSVAVNLRESSPFRSAEPKALDKEQLERWNRSLNETKQLLRAGLSSDALEQAQEAMNLHANHAELHFLIGQCHWQLQDYTRARKHFIQARDLDTLRFRTDSRLNEIAKNIATTHPSDKVIFVDSAALFAYNAPNGIPGDELFWDHVHLRFPGNYLLALVFAREIENQLYPGNDTKTLPPWPSLSDCAHALTLTRWSDYQMTLSMRRRLNEEPFRSQSIHGERDQRLARELQQHEIGATTNSFSILQSVFQQALENNANDFVLRDQYGKYLFSFNRRDDAVEQWHKVIEQVPFHLMAHFQIGQALAEDPDRADEAEASLRKALEIRAETADILIALGKSLKTQGNYQAALTPFRKALDLRPTAIEGLLGIARTHLALNQAKPALGYLERAVALAPHNTTIATELAALLSQVRRNY